MASGLLDAGKINKGKSRWGEGNKVYTRRLKKPTKAAAASPTATDVVAVASPTTKPASPPATPNNHQTLQTLATNSETQLLSPVLEASNEQSVQNLDPPENEVVKPVVVVVDGWVKINLKAAKSKSEIIELAETMKAKLERVRLMTRKLDDKEAELTAFSAIYNHTQYSGNEVNDVVDRRALFRVNSEVGSVTNSVIRPFHQLSVSVVNNNNNNNNNHLNNTINHGVGEFVEKEKRTPKANPYYQSSEFLLGKDRLPPESNKRHKSNSGRKPNKDSDHVKLFRSCNSLLQRLMKHKHGWVFNEPVNAKMLGLHDYHDIIEHPMDLGTIKSRLAQNFYKSPIEFAEDVRLVFRNAMLYNQKGQDVHTMAEQLSDIFEEKWPVIEYETESNPNLRYGMIYDPNTPTPTSRKVPHFAHDASRMPYTSESMGPPVLTRQNPPPTRTPVLKKPKARDLNKRNMTFEEKQKLSTNLQSLPSEKLDNIVQIIKKNATVSQHDDEIEVDIDSVDIETLWELDRFVTNYKKNLSKHKRKAELAQQAREQAGEVHQIMNPAQSFPGALKEDKTNEKTLAGRSVNQGDTGGDNDSSSSSSSSDSSSSDSDSDSSSSDGSDTGHSPKN